MKAIQAGIMDMNEAAIKHGIPKTTLKDRLSNRIMHTWYKARTKTVFN